MRRTPPPTNTMEGPGYSITREAPAAARPMTPSTETVVATEKRTDPIICQGDRLMRIDGETMEFTGDAVIAEKGCDLYISNASIRAGGVGIIARQARVHIVNSTIGGTRGSYEVSDGAELYAARSTFSGIGRRFDTADNERPRRQRVPHLALIAAGTGSGGIPDLLATLRACAGRKVGTSL